MKVTNINGTSEYDCSCSSWIKHGKSSILLDRVSHIFVLLVVHPL